MLRARGSTASSQILDADCVSGCVLQVRDLPVSGLFFAIGHEPATAFLEGQLELDEAKYIMTQPGA